MRNTWAAASPFWPDGRSPAMLGPFLLRSHDARGFGVRRFEGVRTRPAGRKARSTSRIIIRQEQRSYSSSVAASQTVKGLVVALVPRGRRRVQRLAGQRLPASEGPVCRRSRQPLQPTWSDSTSKASSAPRLDHQSRATRRSGEGSIARPRVVTTTLRRTAAPHTSSAVFHQPRLPNGRLRPMGVGARQSSGRSAKACFICSTNPSDSSGASTGPHLVPGRLVGGVAGLLGLLEVLSWALMTSSWVSPRWPRSPGPPSWLQVIVFMGSPCVVSGDSSIRLTIPGADV